MRLCGAAHGQATIGGKAHTVDLVNAGTTIEAIKLGYMLGKDTTALAESLNLKGELAGVKKANEDAIASSKKDVDAGLQKNANALSDGLKKNEVALADGLKKQDGVLADQAKTVKELAAKLAKFEACAKKGELLGKDDKCVSAEPPTTRDDKSCSNNTVGITRYVTKVRAAVRA